MNGLKKKHSKPTLNDLVKVKNDEKKINKFFRKINFFLKAIKTWFIAEYAIFQRLRYFLNKKNKQFQIESVFIDKKNFFVRKYGYEDGLKRYDSLCSKLTDSYFLNKKINEKFD